MQYVVIEIDHIDRDAPGGPEMRCLGFVSPAGTRVRSAATARRYEPWQAREAIEAMRAVLPNVVLRTVPAPRAAGVLERAMAGDG